MIIYGRNPVWEALQAGRREVTAIWATHPAEWADAQQAEADELERLCGSREHQGVCAEVGPYPYVDESELLDSGDALVVVLDQVQDPHNLGAVARVAETVGASGIAIPERRSAEVTPAACKASAGAVEHLRIARVRNVADFLGQAKEAGAWV